MTDYHSYWKSDNLVRIQVADTGPDKLGICRQLDSLVSQQGRDIEQYHSTSKSLQISAYIRAISKCGGS